jgi:hypothetical protein
VISALYSASQLSLPLLVALLVCLIPTTIGGLLSAIGIAGMDRRISSRPPAADPIQRSPRLRLSSKFHGSPRPVGLMRMRCKAWSERRGTRQFGIHSSFEILCL